MKTSTEARDRAEPTRETGVIVGYHGGRSSGTTVRLGVGTQLRSGSVVYDGATIGDRFESGHNVVVREGVVIGDDVSIWSNTVVDYDVHIGDRVKIHAGCYIAQHTEIEDDAFLAPGVVLANDLFPGIEASAAAMHGPLIRAGAQIGANVTLLPYVVVGEGAIIGAGSVVTRDIPPRMIAYGCPAVPVRGLDDVTGIESRVQRALTQRRTASIDPTDRG